MSLTVFEFKGNGEDVKQAARNGAQEREQAHSIAKNLTLLLIDSLLM